MGSSAIPSTYHTDIPPTFLPPEAARARLRDLVREFLDLELEEYECGSDVPRLAKVELEVRYGYGKQLLVDRCRLMGPVVVHVDRTGRRIYDAARFSNWSADAFESEMWAAIDAIGHPLMVSVSKTFVTSEILCEA